jgi:hypothetical protein
MKQQDLKVYQQYKFKVQLYNEIIEIRIEVFIRIQIFTQKLMMLILKICAKKFLEIIQH